MILEGDRLFTEFKGALTENFVFQELLAKTDLSCAYWRSKSGMAEIDFLLQKSGVIIPLEVKANVNNLKAKSLAEYSKKYQPVTSLRASLADYSVADWVTNIPLYVYALGQFLQTNFEDF